MICSQSTGNDVTHSSQATSPRRLTKQSAFESPTNDQTAAGADRPQTVVNANVHGANQKADTVTTQRQRLRKAGPFVVDSQSIPDSRTKYAGAWPPAYENDSEGNDSAAQPSGAKIVRFHLYSVKITLIQN